MPLPIAHGAVGASLVALVHPQADSKRWKPLVYGFLLANSPDADWGFLFLLGWHGYHRGFTHSIFFALVVAGAFFLLLRRENWRVPLGYSLAFLSHALLDAAGAKGGGVRLLAPFDYEQYGFGLIRLSELARGLLLVDMLYFSMIEFVIFIPVFLLILLIKRVTR